MDPQACLCRILDAIENQDRDEIQYACEDLAKWISKGGFLPVLSLPATLQS